MLHIQFSESEEDHFIVYLWLVYSQKIYAYYLAALAWHWSNVGHLKLTPWHDRTTCADFKESDVFANVGIILPAIFESTIGTHCP